LKEQALNEKKNRNKVSKGIIIEERSNKEVEENNPRVTFFKSSFFGTKDLIGWRSEMMLGLKNSLNICCFL
jgi:hypothetical protein